MSELFVNNLSLIFILILGIIFRRMNYFGEAMIRKLTAFIGEVLLPCVLFTNLINLKIRSEHLLLTVAFFLFLSLELVLSYLVYRLLHIKRSFFIFFSSAFAFGLMAIPMFTTAFGGENMDYLLAMGVGHELFFSLIYVPFAKQVLNNEPWELRSVLNNMKTPLMLMVILALVLNLTGLRSLVEATILGQTAIVTISKLSSTITVMTMLVIGYRVHFSDMAAVTESIAYVAFRYVSAFAIGYAMKILWLDHLIQSVYFDHAFFTLLTSYGSTILVVFVGNYCSAEDTKIASNAFALNVLVGIGMFLLYLLYI